MAALRFSTQEASPDRPPPPASAAAVMDCSLSPRLAKFSPPTRGNRDNYHSVRFLTDFADQAVIMPLVLAVAVALALQGWRRGAFVWLAVVAVTFIVMLMLKL